MQVIHASPDTKHFLRRRLTSPGRQSFLTTTILSHMIEGSAIHWSKLWERNKSFRAEWHLLFRFETTLMLPS